MSRRGCSVSAVIYAVLGVANIAIGFVPPYDWMTVFGVVLGVGWLVLTGLYVRLAAVTR